jgi:hypothetical protein
VSDIGWWDKVRDVLNQTILASDPATPAADDPGWSDTRAGQIAEGGLRTVVGVARGGFGIVKDLALVSDSAVGKDSDRDVGSTLARRIPARIGDIFGAALGPHSLPGEVVEAAPELVKGPGRAVVSGLETAYREGVAEPLASTVTAGSLLESRTYRERSGAGRWTGLARPGTWRDAYRISQRRSPGQALSLAFGTEDILDPAEVAAYERSDMHQIVSGAFDAAARLELDPSVLAGRALKAGRTRLLVKPITAMTDVEKVLASRQIAKFNARVEGMDAGRIRHQFFPDLPQGAALSTALAEAPDAAARLEVLRGAWGDLAAMDRLGRELPALANQIRRVADDKRAIEVLHREDSLFDLADEIARLQAELDELLPAEQMARRRAMISNSLPYTPRVSRFREAQAAVNRSEIYQRSPFAAPLRVFYEFRPRNKVDLHAPDGDVQVARMLRRADLPAERQEALRAEYMRALDPDERRTALARIEDEAVRSVADKAGIGVEALEKVLADAARQRGVADTIIRSRTYDGEGRSLIQLRGHGPPVDMPLLRSQLENFAPIVDMDSLRQAASKVGRWALEHPGVSVPHEILSSFYKLWRPAQYLRAAWPVRIIMFNEMRILSKVGFLAHVDNFATWALNHVEDELATAATGERVPYQPGHRRPFPGRTYHVPPSVRVWRGEVLGAPAVDLDKAGLWFSSSEAYVRKHLRIAQQAGYEIGEIHSVDVPPDVWDAARQAVAGRVAGHRGLLPSEWATGKREVAAARDVAGAFGRPGEGPNIFKDLASSRASMLRSYQEYERGVMHRYTQTATGEHRHYLPADEGAGAAWERAVNRQLGGDAMGRQVLQGRTNEQIKAWLHTDKGREYRVGLEFRQDLDAWVDAVREQAEAYLPTPALKERALARKATAGDLAREVPNVDARPVVHGEVLAQTLGRHPAVKMFSQAVEGLHTLLGSMPIDAVTWHPYADTVYRSEVSRLLGLLEKQLKDGYPSGFDEAVESHRAVTAARDAETAIRLPPVARVNAMGRENQLAEYAARLYREQSPGQFLSMFGTTSDMTARRIFFANNRDLALGQGEGAKGILAELDPAGLRGYVSQDKPGWEFSYRQGKAELIGSYNTAGAYQGALRRITVPRGLPFTRVENAQLGNLFRELESQGWARSADEAGVVMTHPSWQPGQEVLIPPAIPRRRTVEITDDMIRSVEARAREKMVADTRKLLFDVAEETDAGHLLRFAAPFYGPWREELTVWANLAVEEPAHIARLYQALKAPERAGLLQKNQAGDDVLVLRIPEWARDIPGARRALGSQSNITVNPKTVNILMQGLPFGGPIVQIPVYALVKDRPDLASNDMVNFMFPYGLPEDGLEMVLPNTARRAYEAAKGDEDRTYQSLLLRIYFSKVVDYNLRKRGERPTYAEAKEEADALYRVRTVAAYFSPISFGFQSAYQTYIDAYRNLLKTDPENADERFLEAYGPEYFPLTQAVTRSKDGIPPTLEGWRARRKYQSLIEAHPDLGGLIVGAEGAGEFNGNAYRYSLETRVAPGSKDLQREMLSFEEASKGPDVRLGWIEYGRMSDILDAELLERGLSNVNQKAAADIRDVRKARIRQLAEKYPGWWEEFNTRDSLRWERRLKGLEDIAAHRDMFGGRRDIEGIAEYLRIRRVVVGELGSRRGKRIDAVGNEDVLQVWNAAVGRLVLSNPMFGAAYHRWLEHDPLTPYESEAA